MTIKVITPDPENDKARLALLLARRATRQSIPKLFEEVLTLRQPLIDHSWEELSERGAHCLGIGYGAFRHLQAEAIGAGKVETLQAPLAETYSRLIQMIVKSELKAKFIQTLRNKLEQSDPQVLLDKLITERQKTSPKALSPELVEKIRAAVTTKPIEQIDFEDSIEKLSKGKTKNVSLLEPYSLRAGSSAAADIDQRARFALLCLCRGLLATVHGEFNLAEILASPPTRPADFDELCSALESIVDEFEACLRQGQQEIYGAMVTTRPAVELAGKAVFLAGTIESTLTMLVRTQSIIRRTMTALMELGKNTKAKKMGRIGLRAGMLTREAIASHCACYRLAIAVHNPHPAKDVATLIKKTHSLPFAVTLPNGKNTALKKLDSDLEGVFVEIEGFVKAVDAERGSDGKLISHVSLLDPSSGSTADAVAVFAHLPHAGVTKDSFCRLSGIYKKSSALFQGQPAVETDVLSLGELSKASWHIAFLRLADRWFQPWRNNMNLYWSLGPHGGSAAGEGFFGAGELLFMPFVRK